MIVYSGRDHGRTLGSVAGRMLLPLQLVDGVASRQFDGHGRVTSVVGRRAAARNVGALRM